MVRAFQEQIRIFHYDEGSRATTTTATTALDLTAPRGNFGATTTLNEVSDRPQQNVGKNRYQN